MLALTVHIILDGNRTLKFVHINLRRWKCPSAGSTQPPQTILLETGVLVLNKYNKKDAEDRTTVFVFVSVF